MRYILKIPVLPVFEENMTAKAIINELFSKLDATIDESLSLPGISIQYAEFELDEDTHVNVDFWIAEDVGSIEFDDLLQGADGALFLIDTNNEEHAKEIFSEYLSILGTLDGYISPMGIMIDTGSPITVYDEDLASTAWKQHVIEMATVNSCSLEKAIPLLYSLLQGIIAHPECGPIHRPTTWIREVHAWRNMHSLIASEVSRVDMTYLGRNFHYVYELAKQDNKSGAAVLGSISSRWHEMAGNYLLALKLSREIGDGRRTRHLKTTYLDSLIEGAVMLVGERRFAEAARKYEEAAFWNRAEMVNYEIEDKLFKQAIDAWIAAFEIRNVPQLVEQVKAPATLLGEVKDKIMRGIDFLQDKGLLEKAGAVLGIARQLYLRHDLHAAARVLSDRLVEVRLALLREKVQDEFLGDAMLILDGLVELDGNNDVDVVFPSELLSRLCELLIAEGIFQEYEKVLALVVDIDKKKDLNKLRVAKEEALDAEKKSKDAMLKKSIHERLLDYHVEERADALRYVESRLKLLEEMIGKGGDQRALHFLDVSIQLLEGLDQPEACNQLATRVLLRLIKNNSTISVHGMRNHLTRDDIDMLASTIVEQATKFMGDGNGGLDLAGSISMSDFLEHYMHEMRGLDEYERGDQLKTLLVKALHAECHSNCMGSLDTVQARLAEEKLDQLLSLLKSTSPAGNPSINLDPVHDKLARYYLDAGNLEKAEIHINAIEDLELRKPLHPRLVRHQREREEQVPSDYEEMVQRRHAMEELQDVKRALFLSRDEIDQERVQRYQHATELVSSGAIPGLLAATTTNIDDLDKKKSMLLASQEALLRRALDDRDHGEIAIASLVLSLLHVAGKNTDGVGEVVASFKNSNYIKKENVLELPAWRLLESIHQGIELEYGELLSQAIGSADMLPLVMGERALVFTTLGKPVPASAFKVGVTGEADKLREQLSEILPYLLETSIASWEQVSSSMLVRRQVLLKKGEMPALKHLETGELDMASMLYQNQAFTLLDSGEGDLGWTSLWLSILSLLSTRTGLDQVTTVFKNVLKSHEGSELVVTHPMSKLVKILLRALRSGAEEIALALSNVHAAMPLIDSERERLHYEDIIKKRLEHPF